MKPLETRCIRRTPLGRLTFGRALLGAAVPILALALSTGSVAQTSSPDSNRSREYEKHALREPGDPTRGRALFRDAQRARCLSCHKTGDEGGSVGPNLSHIGSKFDRPHLIESLLEPSRQIVEGYRATTVVTRAGVAVTGVVQSDDETAVTLVDSDARERVVQTRDIARRETSATSIMPANVAGQLSRSEFADLIAYLETLRAKGSARFGGGVRGPIVLPRGFEISTVVTGLTAATALEASSDGRVFVCEQMGALRIVRDGELLAKPFVELDVAKTWERGLIGVTLDPKFPAQPFVYVVYTARDPHPHHRVSRFTANGDRAEPGSELVLFEGDDQSRLGGNIPAGHQGGAIHFAPDGSLFVSIGEQTAGKPAQRLDSLLGKILRLRPDGSIPNDNPFVAETQGKYRAIWASGCRNPFTFAIRQRDGLVLINDVGGKFEEINRGSPGANYGWPTVDHGPTDRSEFASPVHAYPQASIAGGDFAPESDAWPEPFRGRYFFADFVRGWIRTLDPEHPGDVREFAGGLRRPVDLRFANDGALYVLLRNAWVLDDKFEPNTGSLVRVSWSGGSRIKRQDSAEEG